MQGFNSESCPDFALKSANLDYEQSLFFLQSVEQNARHANGHAPASRGFAARAHVHSSY